MGKKDLKRHLLEVWAAYQVMRRAPAADKPQLFIRYLAANRRYALALVSASESGDNSRYYNSCAYRYGQQIHAAKEMRQLMEAIIAGGE